MGVISEEWQRSSTGSPSDAVPYIMPSIEARIFLRSFANCSTRDSAITSFLNGLYKQRLDPLCDYMIETGRGNRDVWGGILCALDRAEESGNREAAILHQRINALIAEKVAQKQALATNPLPQRAVSL